MKLYTFLNFNGNCRAAFEFYQEHLGGKIVAMMTHGDAPGGNVAPERSSAIMYARMELGGMDLAASDVPAERHQPMRSAYLSLEVSDAAEAERIYALLSEEGGEVFMPMEETFWAIRFAVLRDRFGTLWMVSASKPAPGV